MCVMTNKRESQMGLSFILRGNDAETTGDKVCVDPGKRQQIGSPAAVTRCCHDVMGSRLFWKYDVVWKIRLANRCPFTCRTILPYFTPSNVNVILLKSTFSALQFPSLTMRVCLHSFSRCCLPKCEVAQNSEKIWNYSSLRSCKVIDLGANRKRISNFVSYLLSRSVFEISTHKTRK